MRYEAKISPQDQFKSRPVQNSTEVLPSNVYKTASRSGNAVPAGAPPVVRDVIQSSGQPLDGATRAFMEPRFGYDFSGVRVHTDSKAAQSARAVNAHAYTVGNHVAFADERYAPASPAGKKLIAHELAHVVQQGRGGMEPSATGVSSDSALERDAEHAASAVSRGSETVLVSGASVPKLVRQEDETLSYRERLRRRLAGAYQAVKTIAPPTVQAYLLTPLKEPVKQLLQAAPEAVLKRVEREAAPVLQTVEALPALLSASKPNSAAPPQPQVAPAQKTAAPATVPSARPVSQVAPAAAPAADWTTQTEWRFATSKHSPFPMHEHYDTGNSVANFALNKLILPWDNALNAVANTPFEMMGELDDSMMHSPFSAEWQAAQVMMPLEGAAMEAPGALLYLRGLLSSTSRTAAVETQLIRGLGAAETLPSARFSVPPSTPGQLLLPGFEELTAASPVRTAVPSWELPNGLTQSTEHLIPLVEGSPTMQPRQMQFFDLSRPSGVSAAKWNKSLRDLYKFTPPKGGGVVKMQEQLLTFDGEGNLTQVMTNQEMLGTRVEYFAKNYPGKAKGYDFGHLGGINEFGTNDWLSQSHGGFAMEAEFNRTGAFAVAEGRSGVAVSELAQQGRPFLKVAEAKGFANGVPSEIRIYVESAGQISYDSGWMSAPKVP